MKRIRLRLALSLFLFSPSVYAQWTQVPTNGSVKGGTWPSGRGWNRVVYDSVKGRVLVYDAVSPCGDPFSNSIWAYDVKKNTFTREWWSGGGADPNGICTNPQVYVNPPNGPGDRHPLQQTAYDTVRGNLIQVGGVEDRLKCDGSGPGICTYMDTWEFNSISQSWTHLADEPPGLARKVEGSVAYDPVHQIAVFYGGTIGGATDTNTWEFHLSTGTWVKTATTGPSGRIRNTMIYDGTIRQVLCYGGMLGTTIYNDLWAYDASAHKWTQLHPTGPLPPAIKFPPMAHDSVTGLDYLFITTDQTYAYDGVLNRWTLPHITGGPALQTGLTANARSLAYDAGTDMLVMEDESPGDSPQVIWILKIR
jgi:hypothetical protein